MKFSSEIGRYLGNFNLYSRFWNLLVFLFTFVLLYDVRTPAVYPSISRAASDDALCAAVNASAGE